jgi:SAM-dependent methyltransferase
MNDGGGFYREPRLYDVVHTPGTAREVAALVRAARSAGARIEPGSVWLEPACGTGRYLRGLLRRGFAVRGYDPQPEMLAYATGRLGRMTTPPASSAGSGRRAPGADFSLVAASFTTPAAELRNLGRADVAFCPVNSLRHLASDQDVLAHLEQIAALLAKGGIYLVGLDLHHRERTCEEDVWTGARGQLRMTQIVQYLPPGPRSRRERVIVEMVVRRPRAEEHLSYTYDLRTYTARQWRDLLDRSALRRLAVCDASGRPVSGEIAAARLPYQLEVLGPR